MCGLAGVARNPKGANPDKAVDVADRLIGEMECRGHHATGIAVIGGSDPFIWKKAAPAKLVTASKAWEDNVLQRIPDNFRVILGHTRHSTMNNANMDEAAHPFKYGRVIGAHNGVIYNWTEIEEKLKLKKGTLFVDSQAAFAALRDIDDPVEALDLLKGWFALEWTKDSNLYLTRTTGVPLGVAYAPEMKTLFWCSELDVMVKVLSKVDVGHYEAWESKPNIIYSYDTNKFTHKGTGVVKIDAPFHGNDKAMITTTQMQQYRQTQRNRKFGGRWDYTEAREREDSIDREWNARGKPRPTGTDVMNQLATLHNQVAYLTGQVEGHKAEIDFLYTVLNEADILADAGMDPQEKEFLRQQIAASEDQTELPLPGEEETADVSD